MTKQLTPVAAVKRWSTGEQKDTSLPAQTAQLEEFCKRNGYEVVAEYVDDGITGSHNVELREEFMRMLAEAPKAKWKIVICTDLSRFARLDSIEGAFAIKVLKDNGIKLHSAQDGLHDFRKQGDRIIYAVKAESQHDYSVKIAANSLKGKRIAFVNGRDYGFKVPYGYARLITDPKGETRIIPRTEEFLRPKGWMGELILGDSQEVEVVKWIFETFLTRDIGYRALAANLNKRKIPAPLGGKWCSEIIIRILNNIRYAGHSRLGKKACGEFFRLSEEGHPTETEQRGVVIQKGMIRFNHHPAIIDPKTFELVQAKMENKKKSGRYTKGEGGYVLKDVLFCGQCDKPLYGNPNSGPKKSGKTIYVCKSAMKYAQECDCAQWNVKEETVMPFLVKKLVEAVRSKIWETQAAPPAPSTGKDETAKLTAIEKKIKQYTKRLLECSPDMVPDVEEEIRELKGERDSIKRAIAAKEAPALTEGELKRQWFRELESKLVEVNYGAILGMKYSAPARHTTDSLRELFISHGVRMTFWWQKNASNRWEVARVKLEVMGKSVPAPCETLASEMV